MNLHDRAGTLASLLLYKAEKPSVCLSVRPHFLARRYLSSVCIGRNKTCSKSKLCLWGWLSLFLQAYRTHHSSTGVSKILKSRRPLTVTWGWWLESHSTHFFISVKRFFIVHHYGANSEPQLNTVYINKDRAFQLEIKSQCCLILLHLAWRHTTIPYCVFY